MFQDDAALSITEDREWLTAYVTNMTPKFPTFLKIVSHVVIDEKKGYQSEPFTVTLLQ